MKTPKLRKDKNGYVSRIRCSKNHSGNTRFVQDGNYCQCQGCGTFRTVESCIAELSKS